MLKKKSSGTNSKLSEAEILKLIHELEVHQIELEMQNQELQNQNEEHKHALVLLKESEEKYRLLHENAGIGIGYYKPDGTIISYNQLAAKHMNGLPEDFEGKSIYDIFPRPEAEFYYNRILHTLVADQPVVYEDIVSLPSGNKYFMSTFTKMEGLNNQILGVQVISHEMTERRKVEDDLRESEKKLRQLFENMTSGFALHEIILNAEGNPCDYRFLEINPAFEKLTGLKSINLIGKTTLEVLPNTEPYWIETYGQVALTGKAINFENYSRELGKHFQVHSYSPEHGKFVTIFLDITDHKTKELKILESESNLAEAQRIAHIGSWDWDLVSDTVKWSKEMYRVFDIDPETYDGKPESLLKVLHPDDVENFTNSMNSNRSGGKSLHLEYRVIHKDGSIHTIHAIGRVELNEAGAPVKNIGIVQDITERKLAEKSLLESEERYRLVLENSMDAILFTEPDGTIFSANPAACEMFQRTEKEICLIGKHGLVDMNDQRLLILLEELAHTGKARGELTMLRKDGAKFPAEISTSSFLDRNSVKRTSMIIRDITERKQAEEEQRDYQDRLSSILNTVGDPIFVKDNEHRIILANQAFYDIFALDENATLGKTLVEHVPEDEREQFLEVDRRVLDTGISDMREESLSVSGRSKRVIVTRKTRFVDVSGNRFLVGSIHDITERKQNEERVLLSNSTIKREQLEKEALINSTTDLIWSVDLELRLITANQTFLNDSKAFSGGTIKPGDNILDENLFSSELIAFWKELYEKVIEGQSIKKEFYAHETENSASSWLEINLNPIYMGTQIIGAACFGRTITDRKNAEEEIRKSNDLREQLLTHMTQIRENERALISREIHDQLGQSLTALKLDLNWLDAKMNKSPEIKEKLTGMVNIITSTIKDVQRISSELRPGILDDLGLTAAIEWYAEEFEKRSNLIVKLDLDEVQAPNEQANLALFRVMQESLTNIVRHAKAKSVRISLHEMNEHIVLDIEDDGIGMSVEKLNSIHSLGLLGMHDRIKQVGGTIDILCGSDSGTKIRICIPSEDTI